MTNTAVELHCGPRITAFNCRTVRFSPTQLLPGGCSLPVPTTTQLVENAGLLRLRLKRGVAGLDYESDVLVGQLIAVANESFTRELGALSSTLLRELEQRVRIVLGF